MTIPEIDLELTHGTLGGRFTTVEGILDQVYEELSDKVFASGDSSIEVDKMKFGKFLSELKAVSNIYILIPTPPIHAQSSTRPLTDMTNINPTQVKNAERPFTLILDDPLANSYIQSLYAPDPDPGLETEWYDRTFQQNEELGLNDIKVEEYNEGG